VVRGQVTGVPAGGRPIGQMISGFLLFGDGNHGRIFEVESSKTGTVSKVSAQVFDLGRRRDLLVEGSNYGRVTGWDKRMISA